MDKKTTRQCRTVANLKEFISDLADSTPISVCVETDYEDRFGDIKTLRAWYGISELTAADGEGLRIRA